MSVRTEYNQDNAKEIDLSGDDSILKLQLYHTMTEHVIPIEMEK